ncbi:MAG: amino acid permease [Alphaproteobacteria bacterium]|nr:amino acid permease [Alphaproteobacteria bacterium]
MRSIKQRGGASTTLARRISWPMLTLYGLSVTVGAGIYVLIGEVAVRAGPQAPIAFLLAGLLVALSAASYAELSVRFPVSAGEAVYVGHGFGRQWLTLLVGLLVCATGVVSSATLLRGGAGYIREFVDLPVWLLSLGVGSLIGAITVWGISQSAWTAVVLGVLELGLLFTIAIAGGADTSALAPAVAGLFELGGGAQLLGLSGAVLLAFFAFIGFEDMVNVAEEVKEPKVAMPIAIALTLVVTTALYFVVALVALAHVPVSELSASKAPLTLVFERLFGMDGSIVTGIAIAAVLNGVLVQIIMASRVLYGLSRMGALPAVIGKVNSVTRTPLVATILVLAPVLVLSLVSQTATLAELTSTITLSVFAVVNLALWRIKRGGDDRGEGLRVPTWVPLTGFVVCVVFLVTEWSSRMLA